MGLAAAGRDPPSVRRGGHSLLDSLRARSRHAAAASATSSARSSRCAPAAPRRTRSPGATSSPKCCAPATRDDSFEHQVNLTAFAIFALRAAGHSPAYRPIREAAGWLERQQNATAASASARAARPSDVDDTAAALQALVDAGARDRGAARARAPATSTRAQNPDGGFPQQPGGESNAQSTAWAVQGLIAAGADPGSVRRRGSRSPLGYLESLIAPDGSVRYSRTSAQTPVWVTAQALIALPGKTFPVGPDRGRVRARLTCSEHVNRLHCRPPMPKAAAVGRAPARSRRAGAAACAALCAGWGSR